MKQLLTLLILAGTLSAGAQKKDTLAIMPPSLTDSTKLLSLADVQRLSDPLKDRMSARAFENFMAGLNVILQEAIQEWNRKHQPKQK